MTALRIAPLSEHRETLPVLERWFEAEWPDYYGPGGRGDAAQDLAACCSRERLPVGLVAFWDGELCGIAALKAESIATHRHLCPWAAAGLVAQRFRRRGIGASLVGAVEDVARALGYSTIYCATSTAARLLQRNGWELMERVAYEGEDLSICRKAL